MDDANGRWQKMINSLLNSQGGPLKDTLQYHLLLFAKYFEPVQAKNNTLAASGGTLI